MESPMRPEEINLIGIGDGNEMSIEPSTNDCRLGQLNYDCLEKIFDKLCTGELIKLCYTDPIVCGAVKERAVGKKMIYFDDWNRVWCTERVFEEIGKRIKFMSIGERNIHREPSDPSTSPFEYMLGLIIKHCAKNRLNELLLHFDIGHMDADQIDTARPFLTNLRSIQIRSVNRYGNPGHDQFLETVIDEATHLDTICLVDTWINGSWLQHDKMRSVQHLKLINSSIRHEENWQIYFTKECNLKSFAWIHTFRANRTLCENVVNNCKLLENFTDIQHMTSHMDVLANPDMDRYAYLSSAENLKCVAVTAFHSSAQDLTAFFEMIARKNTVEKLSIHFLRNPVLMHANHPIVFNKYPHFTSLTTLEIHHYPKCMIWGETVEHFISHLANLREIIISCSESMNSVRLTSMVLAPPNLQILKINQARIENLYRTIQTIGILAEVNHSKKGKLFTIVLNAEQNAELEGHFISKHIQLVVV